MSMQNPDSDIHHSKHKGSWGCFTFYAAFILVAAAVKIYLTIHPPIDLGMILAFLILLSAALFLGSPWARRLFEQVTRPVWLSTLIPTLIAMVSYAFFALHSPFDWLQLFEVLVPWILISLVFSSSFFSRIFQRGAALVSIAFPLAFVAVYLIIGGLEIYSAASKQPIDYFRLFALLVLLLVLPTALILLSWRFGKTMARSDHTETESGGTTFPQDEPDIPEKVREFHFLGLSLRITRRGNRGRITFSDK
jgi:hypothetical protein